MVRVFTSDCAHCDHADFLLYPFSPHNFSIQIMHVAGGQFQGRLSGIVLQNSFVVSLFLMLYLLSIWNVSSHEKQLQALMFDTFCSTTALNITSSVE